MSDLHLQSTKKLRQMLDDLDVNDPMSFLRQTNPGIFSKQPRRGHLSAANATASRGADTICPSRSRSSSRSQSPTSCCTTHEPVEDTAWNNIRHTMEEAFRQRDMDTEDESINYADMLPVVMSTIILLASDDTEDLSMEYLMWTERYLACIKDDNGQIPPNIYNLLKHIRDICQEKNYHWNPNWGIFPSEFPCGIFPHCVTKDERDLTKTTAKDTDNKESKNKGSADQISRDSQLNNPPIGSADPTNRGSQLNNRPSVSIAQTGTSSRQSQLNNPPIGSADQTRRGSQLNNRPSVSMGQTGTSSRQSQLNNPPIASAGRSSKISRESQLNNPPIASAGRSSKISRESKLDNPPNDSARRTSKSNKKGQ